MIRWLIFVLVFAVIDIYAYQAFRATFKNKWVNIAYVVISVIVLGNFIYHLLKFYLSFRK